MRISRRLSLLACMLGLTVGLAMGARGLSRSFAGDSVHMVVLPTSDGARSDTTAADADRDLVTLLLPGAPTMAATPTGAGTSTPTVVPSMTATVRAPAAPAPVTPPSRSAPAPDVVPFAVAGLLLTAAVTLALLGRRSSSGC